MKKEVPVIEFRGVSKRFGKKTVLDDINLSIREGELFAIIGRSGSGKSTLMKIFLGIYKPDRGKVLFEGKDITRRPGELRKLVGLTTQENSFYDKLSVYENMRYYGNLFGVELPRKIMRAEILSILKEVELDQELKTMGGNLSGGMKRRLDFAISMIHDPKILILDEPTTGLDPILVQQFWKIIRRVAKKGKTILVISHIFPELEENCGRACILDRGRIKKVVNINKGTDLFRIFSQVAGGAK
jgi:ABC-2 type transport system ATP-binding protein